MTTVAADGIATGQASRVAEGRDELVFMLCGLWMVIGLYIDGWAHEANKPETFFTPWHGVLYSGFAAAMLYGLYTSYRNTRAHEATAFDDRIASLGVAMFVLGGGGDFAWHEIAGIEADLEALVSPTHLLLMTGGLLMVTLPVRAALRATGPLNRDSRLALVMSVGLALAVLAFFLMYLMPWSEPEPYLHRYIPELLVPSLNVAVGMAALIVTTVLFCGGLLWAARRWCLPFATATATFTAVAVAQAGLEGFHLRLPILAATAAGVVADVLVRRGTHLPAVGGVIGAVLAGAFFALLHLESGVEWSPSLWVGAIVFSTLAGYGTGVALSPRTAPVPAAAA